MLAAPVVSAGSGERKPEPFCKCWEKATTVSWSKLNPCKCGEICGADCEWVWAPPENVNGSSPVLLSEDKKQATFHPLYSSGTAVVKGDTPFEHNVHYYWEVKVLTEMYGTDVLVGVGTERLDTTSARLRFTSLLGNSEESYGLSYTGKLRHMDWEISDVGGFSRGTVVGVRVDMWRGTLEFYLNRKPQGISFYNLRRHNRLFPMLCSTAAQSSFRLLYAGSHRATLLVDAMRILLSSTNPCRRRLPPGLRFTSTTKFWLSLPTEGTFTSGKSRRISWYPLAPGSALTDAPPTDDPESDVVVVSTVRWFVRPAPEEIRRGRDEREHDDGDGSRQEEHTASRRVPSEYANGYYVDGVAPEFRVVLWQ